MEIFDVKYKGQTVKAKLRNNGSVYIRLPERDGGNGSHYIESIEKESRGWRFSSFNSEDIDYLFHVWLRDDDSVAWANDLSPGINQSREPFNRNYPNYGLLNDTIIPLYDTVQEIKEYQKRDIPTEALFSLRRYYLTTTLKMLGYDSLDSIGEPVNDSVGYLALNRLAEQLENYCNVASLVHSEGREGSEEVLVATIPEKMDREAVIEAARPVNDQMTANVEYMKEQEDSLYRKRAMIFDYKALMSKKISPEDWKTYSKAVQDTAMLLLELNADLLTPEQRKKFKIPNMTSLEDITLKDRIARLIDSKAFNEACRIENEFAYDQSSKMARKAETMLDGVKSTDRKTNPVIEMERILEEEKADAESRRKSVEEHQKLHSKYYGKGKIKPKNHDFDEDDEYAY